MSSIISQRKHFLQPGHARYCKHYQMPPALQLHLGLALVLQAKGLVLYDLHGAAPRGFGTEVSEWMAGDVAAMHTCPGRRHAPVADHLEAFAF